MALRSLSFDDDSNEDLCVFSGEDLLTAHQDQVDLDWQEVAERAFLDGRRGLVITQVAVLEELIDEFILYFGDPPDPADYQRRLDRKTIGPRLDELETVLQGRGLLDTAGTRLLADLRALARIRNELAHGIIYRTRISCVPLRELATRDVEVEWRIFSRKSRTSRRLTMSGLRRDLYEAIGCFTALLDWGGKLAEQTPAPRNFHEVTYFSPGIWGCLPPASAV